MDKEDLGIRLPSGIIEPFTDNSIPSCVRCGIRLTDSNRSAWSNVVEGNKTQGVCLGCRTAEEIRTDKNE